MKSWEGLGRMQSPLPLTIILCNPSVLCEGTSLDMTRGDDDAEGGFQKFLDTRKRGSENLYTSKPTGGGEVLSN